MKKRIGELDGKAIVISTSEEEVTNNEILLEKSIDGISLRARNKDNQLVSITNTFEKCKKPEAVTDTKDVFIDLVSSIVGPSKWIKGSDYIFYINKLESFSIVNNDTREDITDKAKLIATGTVNKVYKLVSSDYTSITIEEDL